MSSSEKVRSGSRAPESAIRDFPSLDFGIWKEFEKVDQHLHASANLNAGSELWSSERVLPVLRSGDSPSAGALAVIVIPFLNK